MYESARCGMGKNMIRNENVLTLVSAAACLANEHAWLVGIRVVL